MKRNIILILCLLFVSLTNANAQYSGTSYITLGGGLSVPQTNSNFGDAGFQGSASYGYLFNNKITFDASLNYQRFSTRLLDGTIYSVLPTLYYSFYRTDRSRLEVGPSLGVGYEVLDKPKDELLETSGNLTSIVYNAGGGIRYTMLLNAKIGLNFSYKCLYQGQGSANIAHIASAGIMIYL